MEFYCKQYHIIFAIILFVNHPLSTFFKFLNVQIPCQKHRSTLEWSDVYAVKIPVLISINTNMKRNIVDRQWSACHVHFSSASLFDKRLYFYVFSSLNKMSLSQLHNHPSFKNTSLLVLYTISPEAIFWIWDMTAFKQLWRKKCVLTVGKNHFQFWALFLIFGR